MGFFVAYQPSALAGDAYTAESQENGENDEDEGGIQDVVYHGVGDVQIH